MKNLNSFSTHLKLQISHLLPQTSYLKPLTSYLLPLTSFLLFAFCLFSMVKAQTPIYQLPNGGFEEPFYLETSNSGSIVPYGFNSFYSGSGSLIGTASAQRTWASTDVRPGSSGIQSVNLRSNTVLLIARANGNLTTGRINAGSMTVASPDNYNYTDTVVNNSYTPSNPPKFTQEITGTPDSLRFWVKYLPGRNGATNTTDKGRIRAYIHGTGECRDAPDYPSGMTETQLYYGKAMKEFYKEDGGWSCYQVPFEYTGTNTQKKANGNYYVLLSMTTNATPGGGANNADQVWFDDIEFVYSAWLVDLKVNGITIDGFQKELLTYGGPKPTGTVGNFQFPYPESAFSWTPEVNDITGVEVTNVPGPDGDADGGYTSIVITAEDGVTQIEYRMYYYANLSNNNDISAMSYTIDGVTSTPVAGFTASQTNYSIVLTDPETVFVPEIIEDSIVLFDETAEIQRIDQPTSVNSKGSVVVRAENLSLKSYNLLFSKVISTNSKLNWIRIGGTNIADFDPDILEYNYSITTCTSTIPTITYEKASAWANVNLVPATYNGNRTATLTVTAEDGTQTVYKVNFIFTNNDLSFQYFRFGSNSTNQITPVEGQTVYERAFSFTSAQTINPTWGCSSVIVNRVPATTVYYPDTNYFHVKSLSLTDSITYKIVLKNTNCYLATGNNNALRYNYHTNSNYNTGINITTANNNNNNPITTALVTVNIPGPDVPPELLVIGLNAGAAAAPPTVHIQQPAHRNDTAIVTLTANDGVTQKIYRVPFKPTLSTDATLKTITSNGVQLPGFNPATENYTLIFTSSVTELPEIDYAPTFQWLPEENISVTEATSWTESTIIEVTAENGTTQKTYTIDYYSVPQEIDAYLIDIRYDNVSIPGFNPLTYHYMVDIPYSDPLPPVLTPISSSPTALVFQSEPLISEPYTIKILVYSENMSVYQIYSVDFNRVKNTNPYLSDIQVNGTSLPDFVSQEFEYEYELSYTILETPEVTATPIHPYAHVEIEQINSVNGTVTIYITAEDDTYTATYTLDISRQLSPINSIESIIYEYDEQEYELEIPMNQTVVQIVLPVETEGMPEINEVFLTDFRSDYIIEGQPNEDNNLTGTVTVTAEDESEETYYFVFERTLSSSTLLTMIYVDGDPLQSFDPNVSDYFIILPFNNSQIPNVTATAAWSETFVQITQPAQPFGTATVLVISEDGDFFKTYTIEFQRKGTPNLIDLSYNLDGVSTSVPGFNPTIFEYNVSLEIGTTETPVLEWILEDARCDVTPYLQTTPNGTSSLTIVTWNQDDSVTYFVHFTVTLSTEAELADLKVDGITIENFNPNTLNYYIEYEYGTVDLPIVTAEATHPDATIYINQIEQYPEIATIEVKAGDTTITQTYTVSFSVEKGDNNYLSEITLNEVPYADFNKEQLFYTRNLPLGITEVPVVGATAEDKRAIIDIIQASKLGDTAKIYVTAINGDILLYQLHFVASKNDNAYAKMIWIDWNPIEDFNPFISEYTRYLPLNYEGTPLILVEPEDQNAVVELPVWSATLPLQASITITAEDGVTKFIYHIIFEKGNDILSFNNETKILAFPNPCSDVIHFVLNEDHETIYLEIFSFEGKKVGDYIFHSKNNTINIKDLQRGNYFYKIFTDSKIVGAGKFIKN